MGLTMCLAAGGWPMLMSISANLLLISVFSHLFMNGKVLVLCGMGGLVKK